MPVLGAAPSGRAADELTAGAGIATRTMHRLLLDAQAEGGLPHGCVLVVDEAGMAETRVLAPLLELVQQAEGKAVLVGDPQQLPPVGAGGLFPALCDRLGAINLTENRRQHDPFERRALEQLRDGDAEAYLTHAARRGRLHIEEEPTVAKQRLLADWWQTAEHDLAGTVMLAHRRADVRDLNDAARTLLSQAGRLGPDALEAGGREFRVGDRVLCRRNDERLGVRNGIRATVVDVGAEALTLRTDGGALRSLDERYVAEHLEHGYALTGHAAQGATVERAFVLLHDQGALAEWGYVACTRARDRDPPLPRRRDARAGSTRPRTRPPRPTGADRAGARYLCRRAARARPDPRRRRTSATRDAQQLEQDRTHAAERLAQAETKLGQLGWRGRRKHGAQLQAEIDRRRHALRLADKKLAQLPTLEPKPPDGRCGARARADATAPPPTPGAPPCPRAPTTSADSRSSCDRASPRSPSGSQPTTSKPSSASPNWSKSSNRSILPRLQQCASTPTRTIPTISTVRAASTTSTRTPRRERGEPGRQGTVQPRPGRGSVTAARPDRRGVSGVRIVFEHDNEGHGHGASIAEPVSGGRQRHRIEAWARASWQPTVTEPRHATRAGAARLGGASSHLGAATDRKRRCTGAPRRPPLRGRSRRPR